METLNRSDALGLFDEIQGAIAALIAQIQTACRGVVVYRLPVVADDAEVPSEIPVERLGRIDRVETDALSLATTALGQFSRHPGQKRTTVYRLPGCLILSTDLSQAVQAINALKDRLHAHLSAAWPGTIARSRVCAELFPGVHMNQVYRHLYAVAPECSRLNLTWQCRSPADVWITPAEAIEMATAAMEEEARRTPAEHDPERLTALRIALDQFSSLPAPVQLNPEDLDDPQVQIPYQLLRRNYVRPHPRAQLFAPPPGSRAFATHPANLPLLCMGRKSPLDLRELTHYGKTRAHQRIDTKTGFKQLCSALHIYGGQPNADLYRRRLSLLERTRTRRSAANNETTLADTTANALQA